MQPSPAHSPAHGPAANDNTPRPASFDAAVIQWMPLMRKIAARLVPSQERDDLVQDTIENALAHWSSYNPAKKLSGWLAWRMRAVLSHKRRRSSLKTTAIGDYDAPTVPRQDNIVELSQVVSALRPGRNGQILMRFAMGDDGEVIGEEYGVSRQRVNQIVKREREKLNTVRRVA